MIDPLPCAALALPHGTRTESQHEFTAEDLTAQELVSLPDEVRAKVERLLKRGVPSPPSVPNPETLSSMKEVGAHAGNRTPQRRRRIV